MWAVPTVHVLILHNTQRCQALNLWHLDVCRSLYSLKYIVVKLYMHSCSADALLIKFIPSDFEILTVTVTSAALFCLISVIWLE